MDIIDRTTLYEGAYIRILEAAYRDSRGREHLWQYASRTNDPWVVTLIVTSKDTGKILLIRQHRVPIESEQIEFPAGLLEENESIEEAALRELREETGYEADIVRISPLLPKSAGLTDERTAFVFCESNESRKGEAEPDENEEIECFWVHPSEFFDYLAKYPDVTVAAEVYAYFIGKA